MILADQHRFDARRAKLDAKNCLSAFNCFLDIVLIHVHLQLFEVVNSSVAIRIPGSLSNLRAALQPDRLPQPGRAKSDA